MSQTNTNKEFTMTKEVRLNVHENEDCRCFVWFCWLIVLQNNNNNKQVNVQRWLPCLQLACQIHCKVKWSWVTYGKIFNSWSWKSTLPQTSKNHYIHRQIKSMVNETEVLFGSPKRDLVKNLPCPSFYQYAEFEINCQYMRLRLRSFSVHLFSWFQVLDRCIYSQIFSSLSVNALW